MIKLPKIQGEYKFNENLAKYSWFKTGGNAEVVFIPKDQKDLINFLQNIDKNIKITIIGNGSNLLIRDGGIEGVVILLKKLTKVEIKNNNLIAECGAGNIKVYNVAKNNNIANYEFLGTIPGTVGGACKMNAGCYNSDISKILKSIKTLDSNGNVKTFSLEECKMEYRKNNLSDDLIFLEAEFFIFEQNNKNEIAIKYNEMVEKRNNSQPIHEKTCGSTFKNLPNYPAWKIIQELGFQGIEYNGVKMSEKHANFLINVSSKTSDNIENLINIIKEKAKIEKNIDLDTEIKIIGNQNLVF